MAYDRYISQNTTSESPHSKLDYSACNGYFQRSLQSRNKHVLDTLNLRDINGVNTLFSHVIGALAIQTLYSRYTLVKHVVYTLIYTCYLHGTNKLHTHFACFSKLIDHTYIKIR